MRDEDGWMLTFGMVFAIMTGLFLWQHGNFMEACMKKGTPAWECLELLR
jgi:hypothetical protein